MFIQATSEYVPARVVDNHYFSELLSKPPSWFVERTGIRERRRAAGDETVHSMAIEAVAALGRSRALGDVELILAASYTPLDTIGTLAHVIQREFRLENARAMYLSTACSSLLDALDIARVYVRSGAVRRALIVAADHNSAYARDEDGVCGHLWGDGAAAVLLTAEGAGAEFEVLDVERRGLAHLGHGPGAIALRHPVGITMAHGREVFARACEEMAAGIRRMLKVHGLAVEDVRLVVAHQANKRILDHVARDLGVAPERMAMTIDVLGNTGCASVGITLHRCGGVVGRGELAMLVTFGGGYSVGVALVRRV